MTQLYGIVADLDNAEIITMLTIGLICFGYIAHLWKIAGLTGRRFSSWEWFKVYVLGIMIFLCCSCSFAKVFFPDSAERLLDLLHFSSPLESLARPYQKILLRIIRAMF